MIVSPRTGHGSLGSLKWLCRQKKAHDAVQVILALQHQGKEVSADLFYHVLQCSIDQRDLISGRTVYCLIVRASLEANTFLGSHIIRMFASCGSLYEADNVFRRLPKHNLHTWSAAIAAHTRYGRAANAFGLYRQLQSLCLRPDEYIFASILKEHGLGTDVSFKNPDRSVSSFAAQFYFGKDQRHAHCSQIMESEGANSRSNDWKMKEDVEDFHNELHQLGSIYKRLGKSMVDVGLLVARICDMAIPGVQLEETILEACTAKGRLIHYHSLVDRLFLKAFSSSNICKPNRRKKVNQVTGGPTSVVTEASVCKDMWQDWHFDYGIFTVLTVPMFLNPLDIDLNRVDAASIDLKKSRVETSDSVRGLEPNAFHKHIGLKVLIPLDGCMAFVNVPPDCLIVQVGECAQILTGGKLQAIAHCVCRPPNMSDISRETFVVFLQPAWHKQLYWSGSSVDQSTSSHSAKDFNSSEQNSLESKIPALDSRWKNGCTFADFAKETTKQYYGTSGIQSTK